MVDVRLLSCVHNTLQKSMAASFDLSSLSRVTFGSLRDNNHSGFTLFFSPQSEIALLIFHFQLADVRPLSTFKPFCLFWANPWFRSRLPVLQLKIFHFPTPSFHPRIKTFEFVKKKIGNHRGSPTTLLVFTRESSREFSSNRNDVRISTGSTERVRANMKREPIFEI